MIHRRKAETDASDTGNGNVSAAPSSPPMANPTVNASFTPLRRPHRTSPSATYGVNGVFGAAQGYESPRNGSGFSPVLNTNGNGFGAGSYGAYGSGSGSWGRAFEDDEVKPPATPVEFARRAAGQVKAGVLDAVRVDRSWGLVWGDTELRSLVAKLTLLNLLSLLLLSLFPLVISPIINGSENSARASQVSLWYNVLLSWPTFAVIFWINSLWGPDVARRAQALLHPTYRNQSSSASNASPPSLADDPTAWAWATFTRLLLIADFTFIFRVAVLIPVVGWPIGLAYIALINSYYSYEWIFVFRSWGLDYRCTYIADRTAYMFGFGLPATVLTTFASPMVNMAIFTLIYPLLLIQALQSRPPTTSAILPSTPTEPTSPGASPMSPGGLPDLSRDPTLTGWERYARVPVFFFARHALAGSHFLVDAAMRERGGFAARKRAKRAF